jgi:hypothetical protein
MYPGLDTLPARNSVTGQIDNTSRIVLLSFDLVNPNALTIAGNFQITAQSHYVFQSPHDPQEIVISSTVYNEPVLLSLDPQSLSTKFVFNSVSGMYQGLELDFLFDPIATQVAWGLDNVRIDWGQPVPEPAAVGVLLAGVFMFCVTRVRVTSRAHASSLNVKLA